MSHASRINLFNKNNFFILLNFIFRKVDILKMTILFKYWLYFIALPQRLKLSYLLSYLVIRPCFLD